MKSVLYAIVAFIIGGTLSYNYRIPDSTGIYNYGTLLVPAFVNCDGDFQGIESKVIEDIKVNNFDTSLFGSNIKSYFTITHRGSPAEALNDLYQKMKECIPNGRISMNSSEELKEVINNFFGERNIYNVSLESPVYFSIYNNDYEIFYSIIED